MSKRGRILSYIIATAMIVSSIPSYATVVSDEDYGQCAVFAMLKESAYAFVEPHLYWYEATERYKAVVIMAYLMGLEHEIYEMTPDSPNFADADGEDEYVKKVMAFAKANPQLGFVGCEDNYFRPRDYATLHQIYRIMELTPNYTIDLREAWSQMFAEAALAGYKEKKPISNELLAAAISMYNEMLRVARYGFSHEYTSTTTKAECRGIKGPHHERIRTRSNSDRQRR